MISRVQHAMCLPSRSHASLVSGQEAASLSARCRVHCIERSPCRYPRLKSTTGYRIIDCAASLLRGKISFLLRIRVRTRSFRVTPTVGTARSSTADDPSHAMPFPTPHHITSGFHPVELETPAKTLELLSFAWQAAAQVQDTGNLRCLQFTVPS